MESGDHYSCLPLPGLQQHLAACGVPMVAENWQESAMIAVRPWVEVERLCATDPAMDELRKHLRRHHISFVVFDMDMTVTASHTRGQLVRDPATMAKYLESACVTDASKTMQLCRALGLLIGIATFQRNVDDAVNIGGLHLVRRVLGAIGAGDLVGDRDVVALSSSQYADMARDPSAYNKNDMIRGLFERRGEAYSPGTTMLIDDTRRNVEAFVRIGGHGLLVEGGRGLVLQNAKVMTPTCTFVPGMSFSHPGAISPRERQQQQQQHRQQELYFVPRFPPSRYY